MLGKIIREVLLDAPEFIENSNLNQQEMEELMAKGLNHFQAFSPIYKYHLLLRYGVLLTKLDERIGKFGCNSYLEIGCGTGNTIIYLRKKGLVDRITGLDINPIRVEITKKRLRWHKVKYCELLIEDFNHFLPSNQFDFIYSLAAFEAINPKKQSMKKLLEIASPRCQIILDMANPGFIRHKAKYISKDNILMMENVFRDNDFIVSKEYYSFFSPIDIFGITKNIKQLHKTIRLIAIRQ